LWRFFNIVVFFLTRICEDDRSSRVKKEAPPPVNVAPPSSTGGAGGLGRPAIPNIKVSQKAPDLKAERTEEEEEDDVPLSNYRNRPVRTYSRKKKDNNVEESPQQSVDEI
jgi:hypothetical protein